MQIRVAEMPAGQAIPFLGGDAEGPGLFGLCFESALAEATSPVLDDPGKQPTTFPLGGSVFPGEVVTNAAATGTDAEEPESDAEAEAEGRAVGMSWAALEVLPLGGGSATPAPDGERTELTRVATAGSKFLADDPRSVLPDRQGPLVKEAACSESLNTELLGETVTGETPVQARVGLSDSPSPEQSSRVAGPAQPVPLLSTAKQAEGVSSTDQPAAESGRRAGGKGRRAQGADLRALESKGTKQEEATLLGARGARVTSSVNGDVEEATAGGKVSWTKVAVKGQAEPVAQLDPTGAAPGEEGSDAARDWPHSGSHPGVDRSRTERLWGFWQRRAAGEGADRGAVNNNLRSGAPLEEGSSGGGMMPFEERLAVALGTTEGKNTVLVLPPVSTPVPAGEEPSTDWGGQRFALPAESLPASASPAQASRIGETEAAARPIPAILEETPGSPAQQVARTVRVSLSREGDQVTVKLAPESLGKVQVVLVREADGITARFQVETPQAQQALISEAPVLRQALEARGVPILHVSVDLAGEGRGRQEQTLSKKASRRPVQTELGSVEELSLLGGAKQPRGIDTRV